MGQLAQEKAKRPTRTFGANTEKNPKEECKAVLTRGQKNAQEEGKAKQEDKSEERRTEKKEEDKEAEEEEKEVSPPRTKSQIAREAKKQQSLAPPPTGSPISYGTHQEEQGVLLQAFLGNIQRARNHNAIRGSLTANALLLQIYERHTHQEGEVF